MKKKIYTHNQRPIKVWGKQKKNKPTTQMKWKYKQRDMRGGDGEAGHTSDERENEIFLFFILDFSSYQHFYISNQIFCF